MGARVEWMDLDHSVVTVVPRGAVVGECAVSGEVGLVVEQDGVVVVEGGRAELVLAVRRVLRELEAVE